MFLCFVGFVYYTAHPSKIRTSCMKKWYMAESGIFGISSSVRSIWHGSGILYRQLLISLQWDLEIFWDLAIFTSMNFELTVQDPRPMPNCSYWCADSKNTTFGHVPFFHARCSNFRAVMVLLCLRNFLFRGMWSN